MNSIDWNNLRPHNNSLNSGFEMLCCILAELEKAPKGSKYERKGTPDGGVECYWMLPLGDEWGWQAKFFTRSPTEGQWNQLDDSVRQALDKHPRLTRYTICMPQDLPDARVKAKRSARDKWNERVLKWQGWAADNDMKVDFDYWGEHQLIERLTRRELWIAWWIGPGVKNDGYRSAMRPRFWPQRP